jgi:hypothetical protein
MDAIDVAYIEHIWATDSNSLRYLCTVFLEKVELKRHSFHDMEIEHDIDPSQINLIADHERLMAYLVTLSSTLQKAVIVTAENLQATVYIRVNSTDIQLSNRGSIRYCRPT